jgi:hypothetical protein
MPQTPQPYVKPVRSPAMPPAEKHTIFNVKDWVKGKQNQTLSKK